MFGRVRRLLCRTDARPVAILVLGMHRSGTSSIAGSLMRLGGDAPVHLLPAQPDNERGFWESSVISALNDEILAAGGSDWQDWRSFDLNRIDRGVATTLRARARSVLLAEFGEARLPIIKDPRMCRLMPFWSSVFQDLEWSLRAVLPLRSPLEVALSLNRRDGIALSCASLIWLRHVLEAEVESREMPRAVLNWHDFLADPRRSLGRVGRSLKLTWPRWVGARFRGDRRIRLGGLAAPQSELGPIPSPSRDERSRLRDLRGNAGTCPRRQQSSCATAIGQSSRTLREQRRDFRQHG